ncbi:long-chain fatty acid--CoA ligase [candidate division KSB1 bacterium]|nr:long-chain fatty acid--CoA ligase [candidate division KSB1 bacterium]
MFQSVVHMLQETVGRYGEKDALRFRRDDQIIAYSYNEFNTMIKKLTGALAQVGLEPNDKIALLSNNCPEWTITDFAIFSMQGVTVPIYQTLPPNQIAYILKDSNTRAIFVENAEQYDKIVQIENQLPNLEFVFSFKKIRDNDAVDTFDDLLKIGNEFNIANPDFYQASVDGIDPMAVCSLVYTSGTTGEPKGVMLHQHGFVTDIVNAEAALKLLPTDVFLSFLPLSHLYERLAGHWCPMYRGGTIHYARSIETVVDDIAEAKPTVMVSVPRLYEKISTAVLDKVEQGSAIKKSLFNWALRTGYRYHQKRYVGKPGAWLTRQYNLADKLVFKRIKQKLGGNFRYPIAGGAPLSVETLKFFEAMGLPIIEGYGMTETHLIITLTPAGKTKYGSCGKPIRGVDVRIAQDGEVLVKGETLMKGYFNKPDLTAETIDNDGWLHTGDIGYLDNDRFLFLTDRKKNIFVTSGGKNVAAAPLENKLKTSRYIDDICLIGHSRKFISALIIPNYDMLKKYAELESISYATDKELTEHPSIYRLIENEVETAQTDFARFEKIKKFFILPEPLSLDKGEITPSLKIKREVVELRYKPQIDAMYAEK